MAKFAKFTSKSVQIYLKHSKDLRNISEYLKLFNTSRYLQKKPKQNKNNGIHVDVLKVIRYHCALLTFYDKPCLIHLTSNYI